ncbi:PEP-CTERM sorting domain-containing protein [Azohydromonas aeria]|uniref:PEP-CTERM sorting domain-containing protein n=1 Tax=Azohydromonas aeria TaxID=2590212 RepID=UPI0012F951B3|nr:PEP-CTERM sorting domain-containing protein [Azohydromonas aeria]
MNRTALRAAATAALLPLACAGAHAAATAYTSRAAFAADAGPLRVETFEGFATGATPGGLPALGITRIEALTGIGDATQATVGSSQSLPFPLFRAALPSGTQFLSNPLDESGRFATGALVFTLERRVRAVGAFIADDAPLGGFEIDAYKNGERVASVRLAPRTLPDSFAGLRADWGFDAFVLRAAHPDDSWGLDDLQLAAPVPEPGGWAMLAAGLGAVSMAARRRGRGAAGASCRRPPQRTAT